MQQINKNGHCTSLGVIHFLGSIFKTKANQFNIPPCVYLPVCASVSWFFSKTIERGKFKLGRVIKAIDL